MDLHNLERLVYAAAYKRKRTACLGFALTAGPWCLVALYNRFWGLALLAGAFTTLNLTTFLYMLLRREQAMALLSKQMQQDINAA